MSGRRAAGDTPLLAWGVARDARRATGLRRLRLCLLGGGGLLLLVAPILARPAPRLVWNASASAPTGLYWVWPGGAVARGDMVVARLPEPWRSLAARRRYLPANVPLVKRVAAAHGDRVCASGAQVSVNGVVAATRLRRDSSGRALPWWEGCVTLGATETLLLMPAPGSFDGRYFGITQAPELVGRARLIWAR